MIDGYTKITGDTGFQHIGWNYRDGTHRKEYFRMYGTNNNLCFETKGETSVNWESSSCIEWNVTLQRFNGITNWLINQGSYKDLWYKQYLRFLGTNNNLCFESKGDAGTPVSGNGCINIDDNLILTGDTGFQHISWQYNETANGYHKNYLKIYTANRKNICFASSGDIGVQVSGNGCIELSY